MKRIAAGQSHLSPVTLTPSSVQDRTEKCLKADGDLGRPAYGPYRGSARQLGAAVARLEAGRP